MIFIQVSHDIWACYIFKQLTWHACQGHGTIITSKSPIPWGQMFARSRSLGISPVSRDCWNKCANIGPSSSASSFRTLWRSSSGPEVFKRYKPLSNLITPSEDTTILSKKGTDLLFNGTSLYSVLLNALLNRPISSFALSDSDSATISSPFYKGWNTLPVFFFFFFFFFFFVFTICVSVEISGICLYSTY